MNEYYVISDIKNFFVYADNIEEAYYEADAYLSCKYKHLEVFLNEELV